VIVVISLKHRKLITTRPFWRETEYERQDGGARYSQMGSVDYVAPEQEAVHNGNYYAYVGSSLRGNAEPIRHRCDYRQNCNP
jgi:hypothetical protein